MKQGYTLEGLIEELTRQEGAKRDFRADTRSLQAVPAEGGIRLQVADKGEFPIRPHAGAQIAEGLGIPKKYWDRMAGASPELQAENANFWLRRQGGVQTVRVLDGSVRAFLGGSYRVIDHLPVLAGLLPELHDLDDELRWTSSGLTEGKLYLKGVTPRLRGEVRVGDAVEGGLVITNSETGLGCLRVQPLLLRLVCLNGMTVSDHAFARRHVGVRANVEEGAVEFARDTIEADDRALILKARDAVRQVLGGGFMADLLSRLRDSTEEQVADPIKAVEEVTRHFNLSQDDGRGLLTHFLGGRDHTRYGLVQAVTRHSQDVADYDRASDFEALGYEVLTLPRQTWREVANAAD